MELERYPVRSYNENTSFEFFSEGPNGRIRKIVQYEKIIDGLFNLAFGDWDYNLEKLIDTARSNNGDTNKVLATVAETVSSFLNTYPEVVIHIQGSTVARNRLYQMNINKY